METHPIHSLIDQTKIKIDGRFFTSVAQSAGFIKVELITSNGHVISDRPPFVKYGESIPLDDIGRNGRIRPIKQPFEDWAKKITKLRREAAAGQEGSTPLTYYCPVNHENSHFTLLEVNDGEKVIRHYDSLAAHTPINGTKKTRMAALVEDEFGDLGYRYIEAPTPQQSDNLELWDTSGLEF